MKISKTLKMSKIIRIKLKKEHLMHGLTIPLNKNTINFFHLQLHSSSFVYLNMFFVVSHLKICKSSERYSEFFRGPKAPLIKSIKILHVYSPHKTKNERNWKTFIV